jgi:hypothetical protein
MEARNLAICQGGQLALDPHYTHLALRRALE